ncbi:MAG: sugar ABC transporter permease [Chloroflexi bacterium]|nr:sugar ABC transporter permease [Chloroflexota bacterium]
MTAARAGTTNEESRTNVATRGAALERSKISRRQLQRNLEGWAFASPWIIGFIFFTAGPMIASAVMAFMKWDLLSPPSFVGFDNFKQAANDPLVWQSLKVTTVYAIVAVPLNIVLGLGLAMLLNTGIRGLRVYRTAYFLPSILSGVAVALLWRWVYENQFGLANTMLATIGLQGPNWLGDGTWALPSLIVMNIWSVGGGMIIYLAGLQGIPTDFYEAAEVDGANWWQRLWSITLPLVTPAVFFQLVIGIIQALQVFTQPYVMTAGGPYNSTLFFVLYLYQNAFQYFQMGYASMLAWILFLYLLVLTLVVFRSGDTWVHYEGQARKGG